MACDVTDLPRLGKVAKATVWSRTVTSSAPIGSDGVSGNGVRSPIALAFLTIFARPSFALPLPIVIESLTAMVLMERLMASVSVIEPP